jgi:hypothetical protein
MKSLHIFLIGLLIAGCATTTPTDLIATASVANTQESDPGLIPTPSQALLPSQTPLPPILPTSEYVMAGAGDIASCESNGDEATALLLDGIEGTIFTTGDNVYESGTFDEFTNCYDPSWGRFKDRTFPSAGNHDYGIAGAEGYFRYFGAAAGNPDEGYYSYTLGAWHIIVTNSNLPVASGSRQEQWLRADLAAHPAICTLAYWHHPLFSSGSYHGGNNNMRPIWQALYDYGADVVLNGDEHNYERFEPQDPNGMADPGRGIRQFVIGTGGNGHYSFGPPLANSVVRNSDTYGVLKLTLHSNSYSWEFIPEAGGTFTDTGAAPCVEAGISMAVPASTLE